KQKDYESLKNKAATRLTETGNIVAELVSALLQNYHELTLATDRASSTQGAALSDVREQLAYLIPPRFLLVTPWEWLEHFPRYLAGMRLRLEKLETGGVEINDRDLASM